MMYNRYVPQPDGSYRRNHIPDPPQHHRSPEPPQESCPEPEPIPCEEPKQEHPPHRSTCPKQDGCGDSFLRQLLPKDFDTGDLIVVLLLLLMAGDKPEDRSNALLTLALYFLM